jgi:hypothetical protein
MSFLPYHDNDQKGANEYEDDVLLSHHVTDQLEQQRSKRARAKRVVKVVLLFGTAVTFMYFFVLKSFRFGGRFMVCISRLFHFIVDHDT